MTFDLLNNKSLDTVCQPWVSSPYSLISWWNMEQFSAARYYELGSRLSNAQDRMDLANEQHVSKADWRKSGMYSSLKKLRTQCKSIGLRLSDISIAEFLRCGEDGVSSKHLHRFLSELENTIRREMSIVNFFYMPADQADFYSREKLFGSAVNAKFPSIHFDMVEAGNCFAMGRGTACVFHLMRIMEVGVQEFGKKLGVAIVTEKNWQNILDELNKAIKTLPKSPATVEMCQASANLYAVRVAWRNEVMHPNDKYTLEEAKNLIGQVKLFMGQLASIV